MKTITTILLSLTVSIVLISCSSDNESFQPVTVTPTPQEDIQIPMASLSDIGAVELTGYPKMITKFENGVLRYWAQYYFRPDGNLLKVDYGYSSSKTEMYSNDYQYDNQGKLVKLVGWDVYDFYWDNNRIIKVEAYNGAWHGRYDHLYEYNDQGQIIQKLDIYHDTTPISYSKSNYSYFTDGNLYSAEYYWYDNASGTFQSYYERYFNGYIEPINLFLDLEIIPGLSEMNQFPTAYQSRWDNEYITIINNYKFDLHGRVIEQRYGNNKIVYEYY